MTTKNVTDASFAEDVLQSNEAVIVDFWADWCGPAEGSPPCLTRSPRSMPTKVQVVKVNIDENPAVAASLGITSIPAIYLFKDGEKRASLIGARPKQFFEKEFAQYLR